MPSNSKRCKRSETSKSSSYRSRKGKSLTQKLGSDIIREISDKYLNRKDSNKFRASHKLELSQKRKSCPEKTIVREKGCNFDEELIERFDTHDCCEDRIVKMSQLSKNNFVNYMQTLPYRLRNNKEFVLYMLSILMHMLIYLHQTN